MSLDPVFPQSPIQFPYTQSSLIAAAQKICDAAVEVVEEIAITILPEHATFQNTIFPLAESEKQRLRTQRTLIMQGSVDPSEEIRDAARFAGTLFSNLEVELLTRDEIVNMFDHVRRREWECLDDESQRYMDRKSTLFLEARLTIPKRPSRDRFWYIKRRLPLLKEECSRHLSSPEHGLWITLQELDGVPTDVLEALETCDAGVHAGKVWLTFKSPDFDDVMEYAKTSSTRRLVYTYNEDRCLENAPRQKEILALRDEAARLLGYQNHAAFISEHKLAQTSENIHELLREFQNLGDATKESEKRRLIGIKKAFLGQHAQELWDDPDRLFPWDLSFYHRLLADKLNEDEVVEYFPLQPTINLIFAGLESFFGIISERHPTITKQHLQHLQPGAATDERTMIKDFL